MTQLHDPERRNFASDNHAGAHPEMIEAIAEANGGHQLAYGADAYTARLQQVMRDQLGERIEVFPVFGGTGANVIALSALVPRWGGVVTSTHAHINTSENGAPERVAGIKLLAVPSPDAKLTPQLMDVEARGWGDEHRAQPLAVSITQATELGTIYTPEEVRAIADHAHELGMTVHMDGARLANAAAALGVPLRAITSDAGVDIVSFGGTKNGLVFGEVVVVLNPDAVDGLVYLRMMATQLASKMRFISAQFLALLDNDLWLRSASAANAAASRLRATLDTAIADGRAPGLAFTQPTQSNALFATLPTDAAARLRESYAFGDWNAAAHEVRWMTAFDTTDADVDTFAAAILASLD